MIPTRWTFAPSARPAVPAWRVVLAYLTLLTCLALLACPGTLAGVAHAAEGDPLGHGDRAASLYRDVLRLDGQGNPLLPLSVLSKVEKLEVKAASGLRILGTGDGQVEMRLPGDRPVEVVATQHKPGSLQHYVVLAQAPAWDFDTLRALKARWKDRGLPVKTLGSGTIYSLAGKVLDTKRTLLCLDQALPSRAAADAKVTELEGKFGDELSVHVVVDQPPSAVLVVRAGGGVEVHAGDVLWFEAVRPPACGSHEKGCGQAAALEVAGTRKGARTQLDLPGRIYVVAGQQGLEVVNEAEVERLLEGVVASEIFHSAPDAALRAQAVAARTDMLAKVGTRHATDPFAICSEVHCQAYRGVERVSPRIAQAVRDTRGLVMLDAEGRLVDAFYHAVSGGHTENNENVWPGSPQPALRGVPDLVGDAKSPLAGGATDAAVEALLEGKDASWAASSGMNAEACRWRTERTAVELQAQLLRFGVQGRIRGLKVAKRGVSGRAIVLEVTTEGGKIQTVEGELRIRDALGGSHGPKGLRSALVLIRPGPAGKDGVPERWTFVGAGFGHGVGMDQTGAVARAKAGQDFRQILGHYYAGSRIEKLY